MPLADRLSEIKGAPTKGCAACEWYARQSVTVRDLFDKWIASGGDVSELWRECSSGDDNPDPLRVGRRWFTEHVSNHHGQRIAA